MAPKKFEFGTLGSIVAILILLGGGFFAGVKSVSKVYTCSKIDK